MYFFNKNNTSLVNKGKNTKIQGDGWKFLDCFKSNFGSQISSQSLNEILSANHAQNPQQKVIFFIYFCL